MASPGCPTCTPVQPRLLNQAFLSIPYPDTQRHVHGGASRSRLVPNQTAPQRSTASLPFWSYPLPEMWPSLNVSLEDAWDLRGFQGGTVVKNPSTYQCRRLGFNAGSGRSPGEGNGNPLQCSCLWVPIDRGGNGLQSMGLQRVGHN